MNSTIENNLNKVLNERLFSFSRLALIEQCLLAFFFRYILAVKVDETLPLNFGKAVHKAAELYAKGNEDQQALAEGLKEINYYPLNFAEYATVFSKVKKVVNKGSALKDGVELEMHFKVELEDGIYLQGYIDYLERVFGMWRFLDWKTNRIPYAVLDTYQIALYGYAVSKLKKTPYVTGGLVFLRYNWNNQKMHSLTNIDMANAKEWALYHAKRALQATEMLQQGASLETAFPRTMTDKCKHCPFADICLISELEGTENLLW